MSSYASSRLVNYIGIDGDIENFLFPGKMSDFSAAATNFWPWAISNWKLWLIDNLITTKQNQKSPKNWKKEIC